MDGVVEAPTSRGRVSHRRSLAGAHGTAGTTVARWSSICRRCSTTCRRSSTSSRRPTTRLDRGLRPPSPASSNGVSAPGRARRQRGRAARPLARPGEPRVLLVGHHDTVFPLGALAARPFGRRGRATGPGVFDMKGGIVLGVHAMAALDDRSGVELLVTGDEEVGSGASRALIRSGRPLRGGARPRAGGRRRRGEGRAQGHRQVRGGRARPRSPRRPGAREGRQRPRRSRPPGARDRELGRPEHGTTVTRPWPTPAPPTTSCRRSAGARRRPRHRAGRGRAGHRGDGGARGGRPAATLEVHGGLNRPPMPESATAACSRSPASRPGSACDLDGVAVGGGSDGNFTAALGIPTLDGLGVSGGGAHADHEWPTRPRWSIGHAS